jgi:hypothetical protein
LLLDQPRSRGGFATNITKNWPRSTRESQELGTKDTRNTKQLVDGFLTFMIFVATTDPIVTFVIAVADLS